MRTALNIAIFVTTLSLCFAGLGTFTPAARVEIVTPKLVFLKDHADEFDVFFLGSSRTYRQIIPELFDQLMAEGGHPVRSFNLGIDGMRPPEDTYVLEQVLGYRAKPLKFVIVESNPLRLSQREEDEGTLRAAYWHDTKRTVTLFRRAFMADKKKRNWRDRMERIAEALPDFSEHAMYWLENVSETGRGHELINDWIFRGAPSPVPMHPVGPRRDGYLLSGAPEQMPAALVPAYEKAVAAMKEKPRRADYSDPVSQAEIREKMRLIESRGGQTFVVVPPYAGEKFFRPEPGPGCPPVFDFSDPVKYPELFATESHSDSGHVNRVGSEFYTRHIVRELLTHLSR